MNRKLIMAGIMMLGIFCGLHGMAQQDEDISGDGRVVTREVSVQGFDRLKAGGVFDIILEQGDKERISIEAEENLQPIFDVIQEGSKLRIEMKKHFHLRRVKKMKVYITCRDLKSIELNSVGNITTTGSLHFEDLDLDNNSVGNVNLDIVVKKLSVTNNSVGRLRLNGRADQAFIKSNSVGSIQASGLVVQVMDIENNGIGGAEINAVKELRVRDSFLGKVRNSGDARAGR